MDKLESVSICVPAYNEESNLASAVEDLLISLGSRVKNLEIIIVDDGSSDATFDISNEFSEKYREVSVVHHEVNLGIGSCYRNALSIAKGDFFTWFPGDHENSAQELIKCLPYLDKDTVVTSHHLGYDRRCYMRRLISQSYTWILNTIFSLNIKYYNGLAIFSIEILRSFPLHSEGFSLFAENLIRVIRSGSKVVELSASLPGRSGGKSKALSFLSILRMAKDLIAILSKGKIKLK